MSTTAVLQLQQRESFERNVTRAVVAGGIAGVAHLALVRVGGVLGSVFGAAPGHAFPAPDAEQLVPLSLLAIVATAAACIRGGDRFDRVLLWGMALVLPVLPWFLGMSAPWALATSGAIGGAVMVRAHLCDRGEERQVAAGRAGWFNYLLGAGLCGGLAVVGTDIARVLALRLADIAAPSLVTGIFSAAAIALFVGLGSVAAHVALKPDPVEQRCEELLPSLNGELHTLAARALDQYRQCGKALAALPRESAREELARTLSRMTGDAVELASEWSALEEQLDVDGVQHLEQELADLQASAKASRDPVARRQLEIAVASLTEELERLEELKLRRERIVAKMKAEVALLDRARVALIGMRSGQVQIKAAALSALARKFSALSAAQSDEARIADQVATSAELAQHHPELAPVERPESDATTEVDPVAIRTRA
ncbi:MAG TPA: hypothetical protein VH208_10605 [Myxococcaceae bacterium]|nr:hypothetical protein [Myxococcaceae bacterium]